jgi:hypothetical protein
MEEKEEAMATEGGSHTLLYVWIVDRRWDNDEMTRKWRVLGKGKAERKNKAMKGKQRKRSSALADQTSWDAGCSDTKTSNGAVGTGSLDRPVA